AMMTHFFATVPHNARWLCIITNHWAATGDTCSCAPARCTIGPCFTFSRVTAMDIFAPRHLLIILAIVLLVFGTKKLRTIGSDLASAVKGFKDSMKGGEAEAHAESASASASAPVNQIGAQGGEVHKEQKTTEQSKV